MTEAGTALVSPPERQGRVPARDVLGHTGRKISRGVGRRDRTAAPTSGASTIGLRDLIDAGRIVPGALVRPKRDGLPGEGMIQSDGTIGIDGKSFSPTAASSFVGGSGSGWDFWAIDSDSGAPQTLAEIRRELDTQADAG
jgi:RAMA domain-containing protein